MLHCDGVHGDGVFGAVVEGVVGFEGEVGEV